MKPPRSSSPDVMTTPNGKSPRAPGIYRPQPTPRVLQRKNVNLAQLPANASQNRPAAPPVYKPQPTPKVLQTKQSGLREFSATSARKLPTAPKVYRPQPIPKVLQSKPKPSSPQSLPRKPIRTPVLQRSAKSSPAPAKSAPIFKAGNPRQVIQRVIDEKLRAYFVKNGYHADRNYMSFRVGALPHVGWKAHLSTTPAKARIMAKGVTMMLRNQNIAHKVDIDDAVFGRSQKFITIYAANESDFSEIIRKVEDVLQAWNLDDVVNVEGDMRVGQTGMVWMRHGQNTPLTAGMMAHVDAQPSDVEQKNCVKWEGAAVRPVGGWTTLWRHKANGVFFFTQDGVPDNLTPDTIAMAILVNGKVVPDLREEPNPGSAPMPAGVEAYPPPEIPVIVGSPPHDPSPIALALNQAGF